MPVSRVVRRLGSHWSIIQNRALAHARLIPPEGVRRSRGSVLVYGERPASISIPKDLAAVAVADLCSRIAAHMLGVGRAETLRRMAREADDADRATERADEAMMHADRALTILRAHVARGVSLIAVREALPLAFSEAAMAALSRREPRLALASRSDALEESGRPVRAARLPPGMTENDKVLAHVRRSGTRGATRSDIMGAIRPKPKAEALSKIVEGLVASGRVFALNDPTPVHTRGLRYVAVTAA